MLPLCGWHICSGRRNIREGFNQLSSHNKTALQVFIPSILVQIIWVQWWSIRNIYIMDDAPISTWKFCLKSYSLKIKIVIDHAIPYTNQKTVGLNEPLGSTQTSLTKCQKLWLYEIYKYGKVDVLFLLQCNEELRFIFKSNVDVYYFQVSCTSLLLVRCCLKSSIRCYYCHQHPFVHYCMNYYRCYLI